MKKHCFYFIILILLPMSTRADFTDMTSVVSESLAGCYYPDRISSIPLNPAAGGTDNRSQLTGSYYVLYDNSNAKYDFFGYKQNCGGFNLTFLWSNFTRNNIEVRKSLSLDPDSFTDSEQSCYYISASGLMKYGFYGGVTVKALYYNMYGYTSNYAFGADAGLSHNIIKSGTTMTHLFTTDASASCLNFVQPQLKLVQDAETYPLTVRGSVITRLTMFPRYNLKDETLEYDTLGVYLDAMSGNSQAAGLEYKRANYAFRCGYNPDLSAGWSMGLGVDFDSFAVDYCFRPSLFAGLHFVEFSYRFGSAEESQTPRELADYIAEEKKATRLYNNLYEQAERNFQEKKYTEAIELLKKLMILLPDKQAIRTALEKNENSLRAETLNRAQSEYTQLVSLKDFAGAYKEVLKAIDAAPGSPLAAGLVKGFTSFEIPITSQPVIESLKAEYTTKVSNLIDAFVNDKDFESAKDEYTKLLVINPKSESAFVKDKFITEEMRAYTAALVKKSIQLARDKKYAEAYLSLKEAWRASKDEGIKGQMEKVKDKVQIKHRLNDELYSKKCYLIAAQDYLDKNSVDARNMFYNLKQANPLYEFSGLEEVLIKDKVIERNLP